MNEPTVKLPKRSDLDLLIDTQWMLMNLGATDAIRLAHRNKWEELVEQRELQLAAERNEAHK